MIRSVVFKKEKYKNEKYIETIEYSFLPFQLLKKKYKNKNDVVMTSSDKIIIMKNNYDVIIVKVD